MRTDDVPELVELIDDDSGAFDDRPSHGPTVDTGGPRWVAPVAGLALAALIGYGVVTSSSDSSPQVAATTTAAAPTTTRPLPTTTTIPLPKVPYYAAELPREFRLETADVVAVPTPQPDDGEPYQFWAETGSTADSGRWFSVAYLRGFADLSAPQAYRVQTARGVASIAHIDNGVTNAIMIDGPSTFIVTAFGLSDFDVVRVFGGIHESMGPPASLQIDPDLVAGFQLLSESPPWMSVGGSTLEEVRYGTVDESQWIDISITTTDEIATGRRKFADRRTALQYSLSHATSFAVDGHAALAGQIVGNPGISFATWTADGHHVILTASVAVPELIRIAQTVQTVSEERWNGMRFQAATNQSEPGAPHSAPSSRAQISSGTDGNGLPWRVNAAMRPFVSVRVVDWEWENGAYSTAMTDAPHIDSFADSDRVYVLAQLPRSVSANAELHIRRPGMPIAVVPFVDVDRGLDRTLAAYAFSELGPYTAEIVGQDGTTLATWPAA
jgi:hypothetical protein